MARIPLQVGARSLDTGSVVSYPSGSPLGAAVEGFGNSLSAAAATIKAKDAQRDAFSADILENEFTSEVAALENEAERSAPADASGMHDGVYGQMIPGGGVAKPGSFDKVFDAYLARMPEGKRHEFAAKREAYRLRGSNRMAVAQYNGEQKWYGIEIQKAQNGIVNSIGLTAPDDQTYEQFRQQGVDLIEKSGLPALEKDVAKVNWLAKADEALFKSRLEKDPTFAAKARAALGLGTTESAGRGSVVDRIIGVESGGSATAKNPNSSATGAGQFTESTWMMMIQRHEPGLAQGRTREQVLALRNDPAISRRMTAALANDNAAALRAAGVPVNDGTVYLAHFAGADGAIKLLRASPGASAESVLGSKVVAANAFLRGKSATEVVAWSAKKMGDAVPASAPADPIYSNIPLDRRIVLANAADVQLNQALAAAKAMATAEYTAHKDSVELDIVQGQVRDEKVISNDPLLNDGDKASLITKVRSANENANLVAADLSALTTGVLSLNPYSADDRKRADKLFENASKSLDGNGQSALAGAIIEQTGVVPAPVVALMRKGLNSQSPAEVAQAARAALGVSDMHPSALGARDGGSEVQTAADMFASLTRTMGYSEEEAARKMIDARDPEKQKARAALMDTKPIKDFVKDTAVESTVRDIFDPGTVGFDPKLGDTPAQAAAMIGEYKTILEESLFDAAGDTVLAKAMAGERFARRYGASSLALSGDGVVIRLPPEKTYPADGNGSHAYILDQLKETMATEGVVADEYFLQPYAGTDDDWKAGKPPRYQVWYKKDGKLETYNLPFYAEPPKVTAPTFDANRERWQDNKDALEMGRDREGTLDRYLDGNPLTGGRDAVRP